MTEGSKSGFWRIWPHACSVLLRSTPLTCHSQLAANVIGLVVRNETRANRTFPFDDLGYLEPARGVGFGGVPVTAASTRFWLIRCSPFQSPSRR